jgi:hypothetical protein
MSPTSVPELERRLRAGLRPGPSDMKVAPSFADRVVTRATRSRRRRRAMYAVAVPVLAAAAAVGVIVVTNEVTDSDSAPVERPTHGTVPLYRWLENRTLTPTSWDPSKPASAGTAMYRSCEDACTVTLLSPSGREIDLADVRPALAERLAEDGIADVSLSFTGRWLGQPDDGAYRIYDLSGRRSDIEVPAAADGDRWELVGWSEQSWAPTLALYDGDRIVRFADWDNLTNTEVRYLDVPDGVVTTPSLGHRPYYLSPVMDPIEPVDGRMPRIASTTPPTNRWLIVHRLYGPFTAGRIVNTSEWESGNNGQSFEACVGPDETLAAPDGRIYQWEVRGSRSVHGDAVTVATAVFSRDPDRTEPTAVVLWDCESRDTTGIPAWENGLPAGGRLDLPTSTASETWTFLGMLPDGEVAMLRSSGDENTYVRVRENGRLDPTYDLPADAQVVIPGGMIGD